MNDKMAANKKSWMGAQTKVDVVPKSYDGIELKKGAGPFIVALAKDSPRFDGAAFPLPTVGCFVTTLQAPTFIAAFRYQAIQEQGIGISDVKAFLGTPSGAHLMQNADDARFSFLPEESTVFIPWGWYTLPLYYSMAAKNTKPDPWSLLMHVPLLDEALANAVGPTVLKATNTAVVAHLASQTSQMWVERQAAWTEFFATLAAR